MRFVEVVNLDRQTVVGDRVGLADGYFSRLRGLLGRPALAPGEGLILSPCSSVHMVGMRFPIDIAFLDRSRRVVQTREHLPPGLRGAAMSGAWYTLELPAGRLAATGTVAGHRLDWQEMSAGPDGRRGSHQEAVS